MSVWPFGDDLEEEEGVLVVIVLGKERLKGRKVCVHLLTCWR